MSYSSFFASGLMAANRPPPSSPCFSVPDSPVIPCTPTRERVMSDIEEDTTPTSVVQLTHNGERQNLRKRRSSLTVAVSPLSHIKSSMRNANNAVQRQTTLIYAMGNRSRSGSFNDNCVYGQNRGCATESNSLMGRLRSGSVGGLRSRRAICKLAAPPPSVPLPPLPLTPKSASVDGLFDIPSPMSTPRRRPLMSRSSTIDNYDQAMPSSPIAAPHFPKTYAKVPVHDVDDDYLMKEN